MTDQDPELRQLLTAAREGLSPTAADGERVQTRLRTALPPLVHADDRPASSLVVRSRGLRWPRAGWLAVGLTVGAIGGYAVGRREASSSSAPSPAVTSLVVETSGAPVAPEDTAEDMAEDMAEDTAERPRETAPASQAPEATPRSPRSPKAVRSDAGHSTQAPARREPNEPAVQAADEVELMQRVNRALVRGEAGWALALLRQLDHDVPHGRLLEERAAGGAIARCMLAPQTGSEELARYTELYPISVHTTRVARVCTAPVSHPGAAPELHGDRL